MALSEDTIEAAKVSLIICGIFFLIMVMVAGMGYPDYREQIGNQQACEAAHGPDATYVGHPGQSLDRNGALCLVDGDIEIIESQPAPINKETLSSYIRAIASGEA